MAAEGTISDQAVRARTGRTWSQWFAILDRWGAADKGHKATAKWLLERHGLSPWWSQTVTIRHEQAKGLREKHEMKNGYSISVSRNVAATLSRAFDAVSAPADLSKWFTRGARARLAVGGAYSNRDGDCGRFLAVQRPKRLRMTWENPRHAPGTIVEFTVGRAATGKTQVRVTHERLATRRDAETMKAAWSWALDSLRSYVETGAPMPVEAWESKRKAKTGPKAARPTTARSKAARPKARARRAS